MFEAFIDAVSAWDCHVLLWFQDHTRLTLLTYLSWCSYGAGLLIDWSLCPVLTLLDAAYWRVAIQVASWKREVLPT